MGYHLSDEELAMARAGDCATFIIRVGTYTYQWTVADASVFFVY
jgi:hypothetical protein